MRDDIYRQVNLGRTWNAALQACNAADWQDVGTYRALSAVVAELRNNLSAAFDRAARSVLPLLDPSTQAAELAQAAQSVLEDKIVQHWAGLPPSTSPGQRYNEAVRRATYQVRDEVVRATEAVPNGGRVLAARLRAVCSDEQVARAADARCAGSNLRVPRPSSAIDFDGEDLRGGRN